MSTVTLFAAAGIGLVGAGVFGAVRSGDALRRIVAINLIVIGVLTLMVALAARSPGTADPVTHAMVLTGLVVSASATAFALALVRRLARSDAAEDG